MKPSTRNTKRTKRPRTNEREKNKDTYYPKDIDPDWNKKCHKTKRPSKVKVKTEGSVESKKDGRKRKIVTEIEKEVQECVNGVKCIENDIYTCDICQKVFTSSVGLKRHKKGHNAKQYGCDICGKIFRRQSSLQKHGVIHSEDSPYKCPICGKYSKSKERATLHMRTHSGDKPYQCDICERNFTQIGNLRLHKKNIHAPESVFKCDICFKEFEHNKELISHVLTHNNGHILKCYECGKMFGKKDHFEKHKELHTESRPFSCDICGNTYKKSSDLKCHIETHDTSRGYICDVCGQSFSYKSSLKYHLRIHSGAKPYTCDICGKAFRTSSNRNKHQLSHTNYKPFKCDQCSKSFRDNRSLVIHKRTHSGNRPYQCSTCFKSFIVQSELNRHRKKNHTDAVEYRMINESIIATKARSTHSKNTKSDQMESSMVNIYDEMTGESDHDVTHTIRIPEKDLHANVSALGDVVQQFSKESIMISLPRIPIVKSNHAPVTTYLEKNRVEIDNNMLGEPGFTSTCQYETTANFPDVYGQARDVSFTANELPRGCDSASSSYVLPASSLCQMTTGSDWINSLGSNVQYGVNVVQQIMQCDTITQLKHPGRNNEITQCNVSTQLEHSGRNNENTQCNVTTQLEDSGRNDEITHCNTTTQLEHSGRNDEITHCNTTTQLEHSGRNDEITQCNTNTEFEHPCRNNESMDQSLNLHSSSHDAQYGKNSTIDEATHCSYVSKCDSIYHRETTLQHLDTITTYQNKVKSNFDSKPKLIGNFPKQDSCSGVDPSIEETMNGEDSYTSRSEKNSVNLDMCESLQDGIVLDVNDDIPTHTTSLDCFTESLSNTDALSRVEANQCNYDGQKSSSDADCVVTAHAQYNMDEDNNMENCEFKEIEMQMKDSGSEEGGEQETRSMHCRKNSIEFLQTSQAMQRDENHCQENTPFAKTVGQRIMKHLPNRRRASVKSGCTAGKGQRIFRSNSRLFPCDHCKKSYSNATSLRSHKKVHKNASDSKFPGDIDKHSVVSKRVFSPRTKCNLKIEDTLVVCAICNKQLPNSRTLQRHMKSKHPSAENNTGCSCETCGKTYPSKVSLLRHIRIHSATSHACPICQKQFQRPAYLRRHMLIHTDENPYRCPYCSKDFACQNLLKPHIRTHTGNKPYQCDVCGMRFTQQTQLMSHKKQHAPEKAFKCDDCGIEFVDNRELLSHITTHGRDANKCNVCGKVFGRMKHLQKHMEIHSRERRTHNCKYCDKTFLNKNDCRIHETIHTGDKTFSCEYCGKQFRHKSGLNYHIRTHTGEKPYSCKICGKSFRTNSYLHKHTMFHTGFRPYKCDECSKGFTCKNDLAVHVRTHTGEKPFACSICRRTFKEMATMRKHLISIHTCSICGKQVSDRSDLSMHVISHQTVNTISQNV